MYPVNGGAITALVDDGKTWIFFGHIHLGVQLLAGLEEQAFYLCKAMRTLPCYPRTISDDPLAGT